MKKIGEKSMIGVKQDNPEQSQRFVDSAMKIELSVSDENFEHMFSKVVQHHTPPKENKREPPKIKNPV